MVDDPQAATLSRPSLAEGADPELQSLPQPRRPGRNLTIGLMAITAGASLALASTLWSEAIYATKSGQPVNVGDLAELDLPRMAPGAWIRGEAHLETEGAIRFSRPLDGDSFRLAPVTGNDRLWVEIRVPNEYEGPYFVPPSSFVGRLVPVARLGLRHRGLPGEVSKVSASGIAPEGWLLLDGESPASLRWALGVVVLLLGFAAFNLLGLVRLLRPVRDD